MAPMATDPWTLPALGYRTVVVASGHLEPTKSSAMYSACTWRRTLPPRRTAVRSATLRASPTRLAKEVVLCSLCKRSHHSKQLVSNMSHALLCSNSLPHSRLPHTRTSTPCPLVPAQKPSCIPCKSLATATARSPCSLCRWGSVLVT